MKHLRRYTARTVIVSTTGQSFRGTLVAADAEVLVLEHATPLPSEAGPLDGKVIVPATTVTWIQVV